MAPLVAKGTNAAMRNAGSVFRQADDQRAIATATLPRMTVFWSPDTGGKCEQETCRRRESDSTIQAPSGREDSSRTESEAQRLRPQTLRIFDHVAAKSKGRCGEPGH